jgi:hypothetical protein
MDQEPFQLPLTEPISPGNTWVNPRYYPTGNVQHWNLGASREIGWGTVAEISYVGSKGTNLNGNTSLRNYDPQLLAKVNTQNPGWLGTATTWQSSNVISLRLKGFNSSYNSLQAKLNKRFRKGITFLAAYTWSHALAEASNDFNNENNDEIDPESGNWSYQRIKTNADFDVRHRFTFSGTYDLPFGKGRQFGSSWNSGLNAILGNWRLNMISTFQTGQPFTVKGRNGQLPFRICDGNLPSSERTVDRWFDTDCFVETTGTGLKGDAPPNIIWGPNLINFDFGLHKEFKFNERFRLQLRGEVFNAFNRVNLLGPANVGTVNSYTFVTNPADVNGNRLNPNGQKITRVRDSRSLQFGARLYF